MAKKASAKMAIPKIMFLAKTQEINITPKISSLNSIELVQYSCFTTPLSIDNSPN
jgi:hypothetical protein